MLFTAFLVLNILESAYGDFRAPILTQPLGTFNLPFLQGFMSSNQAYFDRVSTYNVWKSPISVGDQILAFHAIVGSTMQAIVFDADVLLQRGQLSVAILEQTKLYNCTDQCFVVKDADLINATTLTSSDLTDVASLTVGEIHQFAVETMEKKFCFNMTVLEQKLNLSSLNVVNDEWALFVPHIVVAAIMCRADMLNVTGNELAELLNINTTTLHSYNLNQIENIFFPAFDDLVVRKNRFETQLFSVIISGQDSSQWQFQTMAYYTNLISQFSVRHLEILYKWASAQLFAIENIQLSSYFSKCTSLSVAGYTIFHLSQDIFGYQNTLPSCNVAFVLSRSLSEDKFKFNLTMITKRNILTIIRNTSSISSWFNFYQLYFAISEGIWMETPYITQVQARLGLTNTQIITYSVPQIAYTIRTLNRSGDLNLIMRDNYHQYLSLLLQTYGFSKSILAALTGQTEAQIDNLTIQETHNLTFKALYLRYNISGFLHKLTVGGVDHFVAINLPSFEWHRLVRAAIESSFDQVASAFSTNLTAGTGGVSVIALADGTSSIQVRPGSIYNSFVVSASRLASCLGTTVLEIYERTMPSYQALYQNFAVDLMNKNIVFKTENFNALLARNGITLDSIKNTETVGQTIENRVGLTAEQLLCMYKWSSQFTSFLFGITWGNVSSFHLCSNYTIWPLHRIAVALLYSHPTVYELCSTGPCDANAHCTDTVNSYICTCRAGFIGNGGISCTDVDECKDPLLHSCPTGFNCANTLGSYECVCNGKITNGICKHKGYERHRLNLRLNEEYTKALSNNASDEFKNISNRITNAMAKVYENNKAYDGTEIKGMTNGSIIVDMDLVFTDENKEGISELLEAVRNNSFGDFDVDPNALTKVITGVCPSDECPGNSTCKQLTTDTISCPCNDGYYFGGASCIAFIVIKVEVTLVKEFTEDLNNESSTAYQELKRNITAELFERFKDTENFENVVVLGFRNGSVIVDFEVIYRKDTSNKKIIVGQTVKEKIINGKLGKYQVKGGLVQERPPPPTRLKTTGKTENSIDISWEKPEAYSAFIIKGYEIRHKANTATQYKKRNVSVESLLNVVLTDLDSDTIYEITVHAYNKEGDGDQIKILVTTEKPEDSMTVVIVVVVVVLFVVVFVIVAMVIFFQLKKRRRRQESQLRQAAYAGRTNGDQVAMTVTSKKTNYDNFGQTAEDVSVTQKC